MSARRSGLAVLLAALAVGAPPAVAHDHDLDAHPSLRTAVTDQNFYFVMADRFANGSAANDHGGLPPGKGAGQSGFDPTGKGWYHGGDLQGLIGKLDYVKGLGTTAIWLTPSFKNKAVQPEDNSAGYHGYWITDFTQIDPHLGSNADLRALVDAAHRRGIKVYFDIITNHTADVIKYREGARMPYRSKDQTPYKTASGTVFDDRDYAGTNAFPPLSVTTSFPYQPFVPDAERDREGPGVAERRDALPQPRRHDVHRRGLAVRRLLRPRRPLHRAPARGERDGRHLQGLDPRLPDRRLPDGHDEARQRRVLGGLRAVDRALRALPGHPRLLHVRRGGRGQQPADPVALHDARSGPGRAGLRVPDGRDALRRQLGGDRQPA